MRMLGVILILGLCLGVAGQNWKKGLAIAGYHLATVAVGSGCALVLGIGIPIKYF